MRKVYLGTGTNIGDRKANLSIVNDLLIKRIGQLISQSAVYETEAWGGVAQASFFNQVLLLESDLSPIQILEACLSIEKEMGRLRNIYWGPRIIDVDVLFIENLIIQQQEKLIVPHPRLHLRNFVLAPFCEIAPNFIHPQFNKIMKALWEECPDDLIAVRIEE